MVRLIPAVLILWSVLAAPACKDRPTRDATKVTASSTDDATKPLVDDDYRFELAWPGPGWKLTREADVRKLVPDAVAGALNGEALFGAIIVESAPGAVLGEFTDLLVEQMPLEDKTVESRERVQYAGLPAERYVVSGRLNGVWFRFVNHVFVRERFVYQVLGWGQREQLSTSGKELQPYFDAFKLRPGEIKVRVPPPIRQAAGVGWRVKDGVFESAITQLRVRPAGDWRLLLGDSLARSSHDAEVGLAHANPDVYIIVIAERAPPDESRAKFETQVRAKLVGDRGAPYHTTFAGTDLDMVRVTTTTGVKLEFLHGIRYENDQAVQVQAWFHAADRERALKVLPAGLAAFEAIPAADATKLAGELERARDTQVAVGASYSLLGGVYRSFARGWQWKKPAGLWKISTGDDARQLHPESELSLYQQADFIYAIVMPQTIDVDGDAFHRMVLAANPGTQRGHRTVGDARVSIVDRETAAGTFRYHIATLAKGGLGLQVMFWGQAVDMDASWPEIDAAIAGFSIGPLEETSTTGGELVDHRFGFAVRVPPGDLHFSDQTPQGVDAISRIVTWERGGRTFGALALYFPTASLPDEAWMLDYLEQILRDRASAALSERATRSDATLAGLPARHLHWPGGFDAYIALRDGIAYGVIQQGNVGAPGDLRLLE